MEGNSNRPENLFLKSLKKGLTNKNKFSIIKVQKDRECAPARGQIKCRKRIKLPVFFFIKKSKKGVDNLSNPCYTIIRKGSKKSQRKGRKKCLILTEKTQSLLA